MKFSILLLFMSLAFFGIALAQYDNVSYPVEELGNCQSEEDCKVYCSDSENTVACLDYAEENNLMSEEELSIARKVSEIEGGPGGCQTEQECKEYCSDLARIDECVSFAEANGFMTETELNEAKKIAEIIRSGGSLPGGCTTEQGCKAFCEDVTNIQECLDFGEKTGFLSGQELQEARQIAEALNNGAQFPGGCKTKEQCDQYCSLDSNIEECFNFALKAGFIPPEEAEEAKKMMGFMARGEMPGNCKSKEQCEEYCMSGQNVEECATFFVKAGVMSEKDAEMFKKTGGVGPGGCKGKECETFCENPSNQQVCFEFGMEYGMIPQEDLNNMKEQVIKMKEVISSAPPAVISCVQEKIGQEKFDSIINGEIGPGNNIGEVIPECFNQVCSNPETETQCGSGNGEMRGPNNQMNPVGPPPGSPEEACLRSVLGDAINSMPTPEQEERIRQECAPANEGRAEQPFSSDQQYQNPEQFQQEGFPMNNPEYQGEFPQQMPEENYPQSNFEGENQPGNYQEQQFQQGEHYQEYQEPMQQMNPEQPQEQIIEESGPGALGEVIKPLLRILISY